MKIENLFRKLFMLLLALVLLYSCRKDNGNAASDTPNGLGYFGLIVYPAGTTQSKDDGLFFFQSNIVNNDSTLKNVVSAGGLYYDKSGAPQPWTSPVYIDNKKLDTSGGQYKLPLSATEDFYGKNIVFSLTPPGFSAAILTDSLYSPKAIHITNIAARQPLIVKRNAATLITWNADSDNRNGVVIQAEYLPTLYLNALALSNGYNKVLDNAIVVADNGSISLPPGFFAGYPVGSAQITLYVARGNFKQIKNGQYNYRIGGYATSAIWQLSIVN